MSLDIDKTRACKGKITLKMSDGSKTEMSFEMPSFLASEILIGIMKWHKEHEMTPFDYEAYKSNINKIK